MKLIMNRSEKDSKYCLDVNIVLTPEEKNLLVKHKWNEMVLCSTVTEKDTSGMGLLGFVVGLAAAATSDEVCIKVEQVVAAQMTYPFKKIETLAFVEDEIIKNAKVLKTNLGAAVGFTGGGPREIEL